MFFKKKAQEKTVFFLHIPKCAGTTLTEEVIKKRFPPEETIIFYKHSTKDLMDKLQTMSVQEQEKISCLAGHFAYGVHQYYTARPAAYITLLREPIDRVISFYHYTLRNTAHYLHRTVKENNPSLKEFVEQGLSVELNNGQTRILAGIGWGAEFGKCTPALFEQAKTNLDSFEVVGVSEDFDYFMKQVHKKLGWKIPSIKKRNVTPNRQTKEELDQETLNVIKKYNTLDIQLYHHACALAQM